MNKLLTIFLVILSNAAFANPFEGFSGIYKANGTPVIENIKMLSCNWMNLKNIQEAIISKNEAGTFELQIASIQNNSPLTLTQEFKEYKITSDWGASYSGVLSGDVNSAKYVLTTSIPGSNERYAYKISKLDDGSFYLHVAEQFRSNTSVFRNGSCIYHINLIQVQ